MDDKWRTVSCPSCGGYGMTWNPMAWDGIQECDCNTGTLWIRPKGHTFEYPGGKATGMYSKEAYEKGTPQMPWDWHSWDHTEKEIENFPIDSYTGSFDENTIINCTCKNFTGTIKEHNAHAEQMKQQFIAEHQSAV